MLPFPSERAPAVARLRRDVVVATGPDAVTFLQGQLSQDLAAIGVGGSAWSFLLQPQGKVDAWLRVHRAADDELRLDVDEGFGAAVVARLARFKLRTACELDLRASVPTVAVRGVALAGGLDCDWPGLAGTDHIDADGHADAGADGEPADLPPGAVELDEDGYAALRIACGVPAMGAELTEATIPAEVGRWVIDASVSFSKGCYTGQELVARIDSRGGNVPRHLLRFTAAGPRPAPGDAVLVDGAAVGTVTSAAGSGSDVVGLAYVKRGVEPSAQIQVGSAEGHLLAP